MTYMYKPINKYGNKKTEYNGVIYDSKYEAEIAMELHLRMKAGEFLNIEPHHPIKLYVYGKDGNKINMFKYYVDFKCQKPDGTYLLVEAKGHRTQIYTIKKKILQEIWLKEHTEYTFEERRK